MIYLLAALALSGLAHVVQWARHRDTRDQLRHEQATSRAHDATMQRLFTERLARIAPGVCATGCIRAVQHQHEQHVADIEATLPDAAELRGKW